MPTAISRQPVETSPQLEKSAHILVYFLLATIPLVFGAVHPIVQGVYTLLILVGLGGWFLFALPALPPPNLTRPWLVVPLILIVYIALQSLPLPLPLVEFLSPARAARLNMVNTLAEAQLTTAPLSESGIRGLQNAIFLFSLFVYYLILTALLNKKRTLIIGLLYVFACVGLVEGLYGLLQMMNPSIGILWLPIKSKAAYGTIIYKNQYATLLNICWPLAIAGGLVFLESANDLAKEKSRKRGFRYFFQSLSAMNTHIPFFFFAAGIMILAVVFSFSRGGILAMLFTLVALVFILPYSRKITLLIALLLITFFGAYGSLLGLDEVFARFSTLDDSGLVRLQIYQASLPLVYDHWLTGIGLDSFKLLSGVYLKGFPENILFDRVHNDYLELAIELGLPMATLFFAWLFAGILVTGKKLVQQSRMFREERRVSMIAGCAAFCSLLGFLIHGMVDFGWRLPANALYAVTLLAIISHALTSRSPSTSPQALETET